MISCRFAWDISHVALVPMTVSVSIMKDDEGHCRLERSALEAWSANGCGASLGTGAAASFIRFKVKGKRPVAGDNDGVISGDTYTNDLVLANTVWNSDGVSCNMNGSSSEHDIKVRISDFSAT